MRPLRRGLKSNIFDNMLAMTEKYADNLEALVDERTQLLIEEKHKTEVNCLMTKTFVVNMDRRCKLVVFLAGTTPRNVAKARSRSIETGPTGNSPVL